MQSFLLTYQVYKSLFSDVWLWNDFPFKREFGSGQDTGIDLVAKTFGGDYWAIQCKCYQDNVYINKEEVDSFLVTSSKSFENENFTRINFSNRLWISTTNNWSSNAEETIKNQTPVCNRISLYDLEQAEINWEELEKGIIGEKAENKKKELREHQIKALNSCNEYFKTADRGKLIMACGTGKTFTSLKIAENETNNNGLILFLVPSIALLGQTLKEWSAQSNKTINTVCICSDAEISNQKTKNNNDDNSFNIEDLVFPASTNINNIVKQFEQIERRKLFNKKNNIENGMTVVFSTYQSIEVISKAQKELNKNNNDKYIFDLIICDEAHRTTGVILKDKEESAFTKVHDNEFLISKKRLYMTATPRLYDVDAKSKAFENDTILCSMDDKEQYGEEIYRIGFGEAVKNDLLSDYKVLVLTINENSIPKNLQNALLNQKDKEIQIEDAQKFYDSIKQKVEGIDNADGKQKVIIELYDKFFKTAFPKTVEKLGIVYTPIEVVDFIINSVADVLKIEFDRTLSDENIHILDPFTGTGTFITIYYHNVGDYLKRVEKFDILNNLKSINSLKNKWQELKPNKENDWLAQRNDIFESFIQIEPDKKFNIKSKSFFITQVIGVATNRDSWVYNFSKKELEKNINNMINFYNSQVEDFKLILQINNNLRVEDFIDNNLIKISWTRGLRNNLSKLKIIEYKKNSHLISCYRPFCKQNIYFDEYLIEMAGLNKKNLFPTNQHKNIVICIQTDLRKEFSILISNFLTDLSFLPANQCFPLYYYEKVEQIQKNLFSNSTEEYVRKDAISDFILNRARENYGSKVIKEDIFYYVYGILHSKEYREKFAIDLKKMLPRIPLVEEPRLFWTFTKAGRELADLHLNYEDVKQTNDLINNVKVISRESNNFIVEKIKFANKNDKSIIIYNSQIRIENIPLKAYEYIVNGKSAIEWILDRYQVTINKDSQIKNDPNDWAIEQNKPSYILDLLLSVIELSVKTVDIVNSLPELKFEDNKE